MSAKVDLIACAWRIIPRKIIKRRILLQPGSQDSQVDIDKRISLS